MSWRYFATRLHGDGTESVIVPELPLGEVSLTKAKNAPGDLSASITPEYRFLEDDDGIPLLEKWSTAIYAEEDDVIRGGGILVDDSIDPISASLSLTVMGFSGYPNGMPYTEGSTWPPNPYPKDGIEPMTALREIWRHIQAQTRGNLGVTVDSMNTGRRIGRMIAQAEFDTENGPIAFETEPFLLRWFETHDLGDSIQSLATNTPFDFVEELSWNSDQTGVNKHIRVGYPMIGRRRQDSRFIMGENVQFAQIDPPADEYADVLLGLGAGEGAAMKNALVYRSNEHRIRRAKVFEAKAANTAAAINSVSQKELLSRIGVDEITSLSAIPGHVHELQAIEPGDEIWLAGETPHREVGMWVRIQSKTIFPDTGALEFEVNRSDRLA